MITTRWSVEASPSVVVSGVVSGMARPL
jgi:hypothetical protein